MPTLPASAERAATLRMPSIPFYVSQGKDCWHIIDPESGAMTTMTLSEFSKRMILESQCPPQVQNLFDTMPHYSAWKFNHEHNYQPQTR